MHSWKKIQRAELLMSKVTCTNLPVELDRCQRGQVAWHDLILKNHEQKVKLNNIMQAVQFIMTWMHSTAWRWDHFVNDSESWSTSAALGMMGKRSLSPVALIGDILLGVMAHSTQVHSCYCKITERLIETNDYNNRTLSRQAHGRGSFN